MKNKKTRPEENKFSVLQPQSRREFLRASALAAAAASFASCVTKPKAPAAASSAPIAAPYIGNVKGANDMINVACIGVGGQGESDTGDVLGISQKSKNVNVVALCDVDKEHLDK